MLATSNTKDFRRYEFVTQPRKLIASYTLSSSAPHIAAATLGVGMLRVAASDNLSKMEQVVAPRRKDLLAQVIESFRVQAWREMLRWETENAVDGNECCLPSIDVASDALAETAQELLTRHGHHLFPTAARVRSAAGRAFLEDNGCAAIKHYYRTYVRRLLMFNLSQSTDRMVGPERYFQSTAQRNLYVLGTAFACESAVANLEIPSPTRAKSKAGIKDVLACTKEVAARIQAMPFVAEHAAPKLARRTIACGAESLKQGLAHKKDTIYLHGDPPNGNVTFRLDKIEEGIHAPLSSMSRDLIEVATYVYAGDMLVHRTARWRRSLTFIIPVRNLKQWKDVSEDLGMIMSFISGDHIAFQFIQRQIKEEQSVFDAQPVSGDCVCLLSGGQDSFAGALRLLQDGYQPVLIGHFRQSSVARRQKLAVEALGAYAAREFSMDHLSVLRLDGGLARGRESFGVRGNLEYTQRVRSFLFLGLAVAAADSLGLSRVFIPENGILALNIPLAVCRTGSRSTRSAHPRFLWYFEKIINRLYGHEYKVRNPLVFKTKAEVLQIVKGTGLEKFLADSVSCSHYSYGVMMDKRRGRRSCTHCGTCLACLIRRAAMISAGLAGQDQDAAYVMQPVRDFQSLKEDEQLSVLHLVDFCKNIKQASDEHILRDYPDLLLPDQYFPDNEKGRGAALEVVCMYRRFASEIIDVVRQMIADNKSTASSLLEICGIDI